MKESVERSCGVCGTNSKHCLTCHECHEEHCPKCVANVLFNSVRDNPFCIACKVEYDRRVIQTAFDQSFIKNTLHQHQKEVRFNNRLARMDDIKRLIDRFGNQIREYFEQEDMKIEKKGKTQSLVLNMLKMPCPNTKKIMKCPTKLCKGLLNNCGNEDGCIRCNLCHEEFIGLEYSVSCPNCFEIVRHDQKMDAQFCQSCKTSFSLLGGREVFGYEHNPDYITFMEKQIHGIIKTDLDKQYHHINGNIVAQLLTEIEAFSGIIQQDPYIIEIKRILAYEQKMRALAKKLCDAYDEYECQLRKYDARYLLGLIHESMYKTHINNYTNKKQCIWHRLVNIRRLIGFIDLCIQRYVRSFHEPYKAQFQQWNAERLYKDNKKLFIDVHNSFEKYEKLIERCKEIIRKRDCQLTEWYQISTKVSCDAI